MTRCQRLDKIPVYIASGSVMHSGCCRNPVDRLTRCLVGSYPMISIPTKWSVSGRIGVFRHYRLGPMS
jgi:hypothetical protein